VSEFPQAERRRPSRRSRRSLDWFAFFVANLQAGFGPFVSVYLTSERWTQTDIGLVLTIGGIAGLLLQIPGGAAVDATQAKRSVAAWSVLLVGISALALALSPAFAVILFAWLLHAAASCTLTPALAAISLGLVGHGGMAKRLGRNASFGSLGNAVAAGVMGAIGYLVSNQAVFIVTAALAVPALVALRRIRAQEIDPFAGTGQADSVPPKGLAHWRAIASNRTLYVLFACMLLFHVANAAMLPLVGSVLTLRSAESPALLIAACIIVPQVLVTVFSPLVGRFAQSWGRRPLLLIAFAVLPLRAVCFAYIQEEYLFVAAQSLDGISAAIVGVLVSLVVADATRKSGHFALAQGLIGTGMGIGASISTLFAGQLADRLGSSSAFLGLAAVGMLALVVVFLAMPETKYVLPRPAPRR
jgi:MFS family permease